MTFCLVIICCFYIMLLFFFFFFFFSSRRRHTRSYGDWSSDVCSSDLRHLRLDRARVAEVVGGAGAARVERARTEALERSEERRVGKECRSRRAPDHEEKKKKGEKERREKKKRRRREK